MMTILQKDEIARMRHEGTSYTRIAQNLRISENTVKSYCKRNNLGGKGKAYDCSAGQVCRNCGKMVVQIPGQKKRKFCSDVCRMAWWGANRDQMKKKAVYPATCAHCGKAFESYGNPNRKFCCHSCYILSRFGKPEGADDARAV